MYRLAVIIEIDLIYHNSHVNLIGSTGTEVAISMLWFNFGLSYLRFVIFALCRTGTDKLRLRLFIRKVYK